MRGAARGSRRFSSARQRSPLVTTTVVDVSDDETSSDEPTDEPTDETEGREKIEVHVHVHRGDRDGKKAAARRKLSPVRLNLSGALFDWNGHYNQICKGRPAPTPPKRLSLRSMCHKCGYPLSVLARTCPECQSTRPRGFLARVAPLIGLGSVIGIFSLLAHFSGETVREHVTPEKDYSDYTDEPYVVEVPVGPSPFAYDPTTGFYATKPIGEPNAE